MLYSTIPNPAGLAVYLAVSPTETHPDTPALSEPSSSRAPSQPPEGRDLDWEDYNYQQDPAAAGGGRESLGCSTGLDSLLHHRGVGGFAARPASS